MQGKATNIIGPIIMKEKKGNQNENVCMKLLKKPAARRRWTTRTQKIVSLPIISSPFSFFLTLFPFSASRLSFNQVCRDFAILHYPDLSLIKSTPWQRLAGRQGTGGGSSCLLLLLSLSEREWRLKLPTAQHNASSPSRHAPQGRGLWKLSLFYFLNFCQYFYWADQYWAEGGIIRPDPFFGN